MARLVPRRLSPSERAEAGRRARRHVPRSSHGDWSPSIVPGRDPVAVLALQALTRHPDLVPIRHDRMAEAEFPCFRGAAAVMAADLAPLPRSGLVVQLCGDAHLMNFGGFASPERDLVFDVNDFDEALPGPFEWDLKRLVASLEVASRSRDFRRAERAAVVARCVRQYRQAMAEFAGMPILRIWYARLDFNGIVARWGRSGGTEVLRVMGRTARKATTKDHLKAFAKLTHVVDGRLQFVSDPPLLVPVEELFPTMSAELTEVIERAISWYRRTLHGDRRFLLDQYRTIGLARKVVGVGSVGTRCWVSLMVGRDDSDPILMQIKEAEASVLEPFLGRSPFDNHGQRVVEGQRVMQPSSDILLGWERVTGVDEVPRHYYLRQLWDWKASLDVTTMSPGMLGVYGEICAWTLARGHARSGDPIAIAAYLGRSDTMDRALVEFAAAYADQNERDHRALVEALRVGRLASSTSAPQAGAGSALSVG